MGDWDVVGEDVLGYEGYGDDENVGALTMLKQFGPKVQAQQPVLRLPAKPAWRQAVLTPGVAAPDQMMYPLPLTGVQGTAFSSTLTSIQFQGRPQKPFRGERLIITFARPTTSAGVLLTVQSIAVGTDIQMAEIGSVPAEAFSPTAFGVRLKMKPASVGNLVEIQMQASGTFGAGDSIPVAVAIFGRIMA